MKRLARTVFEFATVAAWLVAIPYLLMLGGAQ